jgi:hypothetical protein
LNFSIKPERHHFVDGLELCFKQFRTYTDRDELDLIVPDLI